MHVITVMLKVQHINKNQQGHHTDHISILKVVQYRINRCSEQKVILERKFHERSVT